MRLIWTLLAIITVSSACSDPQCMPGEFRIGTSCRPIRHNADAAAETAEGMDHQDGSVPDGAANTGDSVANMRDASDARDGSSAPEGGIADLATEADALLDTLPGGPPTFQFRADSVTLSSGNVATIRNRRGADSLVLSAGTLAAPAADVLFGGAPSVTFSGTQRLQSNLAASAWKFLHDGTGYEVFHIYAPTSAAGINVIAGTLTSSPGTYWYWSSTVSAWQQVNNADPAAVVNMGGGGAPALNVATYADHYYGAFAPVQAGSFLKDTLLNSVITPGATPSTADPGTLVLGADGIGTTFARMRWCETLFFPRVLHEYERQIVREYIAERYRIAAPSLTGAERDIMSLLPFSWLDAAANSTSDSKVTAFLDRALPGHLFTQANASLQVAATSADAALGGAQSAVFAGSQYYDSSLPPKAWGFLDDGSGMSAACSLVPTETAGSQNTYLASRASGKGLSIYSGLDTFGALATNDSNQIMFALAPPASSNVAMSAILRHATARTPQCRFKAAGAPEQTAAYSFAGSTSTPQSTLRVGANVIATQPANGRIASSILFNRYLSDSDYERLTLALHKRYGAAP